MKLRCVRGDGHSPFVVGKYYEVAEILEMEGHVMVQTPQGRWPKPGERWFGWHPEEWFASPTEGLPALSCGYHYVDTSFYGVVLPASCYRQIPRFSERLGEAIDERPPGSKHVWYVEYRNVRTTWCYPKLERNFYVLGVDHVWLGRAISYRAAKSGIKKILTTLGLRDLARNIEDVELEFWYKSKWRRAGGLTWIPYKP